MYRTEATLGLIGSIIAIIAAVLILFVGIVFGALLTAADAVVDELDEYMTDEALAEYDQASSAAGGGMALIIIGLILVIAAVVLGFIGTSQLRSDNKKGAMMLLIAAGLTLISLFMCGWWGVISLVLFLVPGIMVLTRKDTPAAQA